MAPDQRPQGNPASEGLGSALRLCGDAADGCGAAAAARDPRLPGRMMEEVMRLRGGAPEGGGALDDDEFGVGANVEVRECQTWPPRAFSLRQPACSLHRGRSSEPASLAVFAASLSSHHDC